MLSQSTNRDQVRSTRAGLRPLHHFLDALPLDTVVARFDFVDRGGLRRRVLAEVVEAP